MTKEPKENLLKLQQLAKEKKLDKKSFLEVVGESFSSWYRLSCDECGKEVKEIVIVGEEPDYESNTAHMCLDCLQKAVKMCTL